MKLKTDTFVVLEGMDATGKSTTLDDLKLVEWETKPLFTHQPSGGSVVGEMVYELTESKQIASPLSRQLLHLASHAEQYQREILPSLEHGPVIMDRCWWSTVAYGYPHLRETFDWWALITLAQLPAQGRHPDLVVLFLEPWEEDPHNTEALKQAYLQLAEDYADKVFIMPRCSEGDRMAYILDQLIRRGFTEEER